MTANGSRRSMFEADACVCLAAGRPRTYIPWPGGRPRSRANPCLVRGRLASSRPRAKHRDRERCAPRNIYFDGPCRGRPDGLEYHEHLFSSLQVFALLSSYLISPCRLCGAVVQGFVWERRNSLSVRFPLLASFVFSAPRRAGKHNPIRPAVQPCIPAGTFRIVSPREGIISVKRSDGTDRCDSLRCLPPRAAPTASP